MRRILVLGLALALAACGTDVTAPSVSIDGSYSLRTINGTNLPYTFNNGLTLSSEVLTMSVDGTYTDVARYSDGRVSTDQGYYTNNNGAINFTSQASAFTFQGSLSGAVLTEIVNGYTQTFQKN
jgi:hypothetical protein